jgi:hypothetical protein
MLYSSRSHTTNHPQRQNIHSPHCHDFPLVPCIKWIFFPQLQQKAALIHAHTHSADSSQSVCITSSERVRERAIELLFIFVHFAPGWQSCQLREGITLSFD